MDEQLMIEDYLEVMDDLLDKASPVPFQRKAMVDVEQLRECLDKIRLNLPAEIKQAKKIVQERKSVIDQANKEHEDIITRAEARAKEITANHQIVKEAQAKAAEIEKNALVKAKNIKDATDGYIVDMLSKTEEALSASLTAVKRTKSTIKPAGNNRS